MPGTNSLKTLRLTLKKAPFEVMLTGEKTEEFREPSDWIRSRLFNPDGSMRDYDRIEYTNGYGLTRPRFVTDFIGFELLECVHRQYSNGLKVVSDQPVYAIKHSQIIEKHNVTEE